MGGRGGGVRAVRGAVNCNEVVVPSALPAREKQGRCYTTAEAEALTC